VVVDPDGHPVRGARVIVLDPLAIRSNRVTDEHGAFRVERLDAGRYDVTVVLPGFQADPLAVTLAEGEDREVRVSLRLSGVSESIVVSAAQVDVPLSRASDSVSVVDESQIRSHQVESLGSALQMVPGLSVARSGGRGSVTSVFPRGGESDYTMVLVDGVPANAFGGGVDAAQFAMAGVERVEVVRGPESALFGSDAIGGVVHVITRRGGPPSAEGLLEGGSLGTVRATLATAGSHRAWTWGASIERDRSDGFTGLAPATGERVSNDDWRMSHAAASGGWRADRGAEVRVTSAYGSSTRGYPGPYGANPIGAYTEVDRFSRGTTRTRSLGATLVLPFAFRGVAAQQRAQATFFGLRNDFQSTYGLSQSRSRRGTARVQTDLAVAPPLGLSFGAEYKGEQATSTFITGERMEPVPVRRTVAGVFGEARYQAGRLSVTGGARLERIRRDLLEADPASFLPRPAFAADTVVSANPKISAAYLLGGAERDIRGDSIIGATRLRAAAGTGIRPPDALEIAFTDNPHLRPERSRSAEAGVEQGLAGRALLLTATVFENRYDDLIVAVGPDLRDASRFRTDNISNARSRGLELGGALRTPFGVEARVHYTFLATAILAVDGGAGRAPAPFQPGDPLLRRPRHQAALDLSYAGRRVNGFVQVGSRGRTLDVEPTLGTFGGLFENAGYTVVNAGAGVRVSRNVEIVASVANLLDRRYEETLGFPALGRSAMAGVRVAAGR
jgi:outer membrane cobalamin receptor